nr:glutamate mutase L [candidate division Zixibacteria bacterium]
MNNSGKWNPGLFSSNLSQFCVIDIGSTTTKAILYVRDGDWHFYRREKPTTVEKPYEDVTFGVINALKALEDLTGRKLLKNDRPDLPCLATSSAGGGLAVVVAGLVREVTARSAERVALGAGAIIQNIIALDDHRTPYWKVERLKALRPDMLLLAGGFDGGSIDGPVFLAEMLNQSGLRPKLSHDGRLPVIYAGNIDARDYVRELLDRNFIYIPVANLRPASNKENLEPARQAIHDVFMEHVMSRAPGYETFTDWIAAPILPTPAAVSRLLTLVSKDMQARILAIDIGGATTDVFTAEQGFVFRTVSANLGMSYSIINVVHQAGLDKIRELLDFEIDSKELLDRIGNKYLRPTILPGNIEDAKIEGAVASVAIREAVREHLKVLEGVKLSRSEEDLGWHYLKKRKTKKKTSDGERLSIDDYDMIIGSGGKLSHTPRRTAAVILLNALRPKGVTDLAVDSAFMFPHLGILSTVNEKLAVELFHRLGVVHLGKAIIPDSEEKSGRAVIYINQTGESGNMETEKIGNGELKFIPSMARDNITINIKTKKFKIREKQLTPNRRVDHIIVDTRHQSAGLATDYFPDNSYLSPADSDRSEPVTQIHDGEIRIAREMAIPGEILCQPGDTVTPEMVIARSTRLFLRPFFLNVAAHLKVNPGELERYLHKKIGDEIISGEIIAENRNNIFNPRIFKSLVAGKVEKILPTGTVIVREKQEYISDICIVDVARELKVDPGKLKPYLKCVVGQEIEKDQWLADGYMYGGHRAIGSPIRGRIRDIDLPTGFITIEPLREELDLQAWIPGRIESVSAKGAVIVNRGLSITGMWGNGGQTYGILSCNVIESDRIIFLPVLSRKDLEKCRSEKVRGLITCTLDLQDIYDINPNFPLVVLEGFGQNSIDENITGRISTNNGAGVTVDATTQLRSGVIRPQVIFPQEKT